MVPLPFLNGKPDVSPNLYFVISFAYDKISVIVKFVDILGNNSSIILFTVDQFDFTAFSKTF